MAYKIHYSDYPGTDTGPPDPERWIGPPGPMGPPGPSGTPGPPGPTSTGGAANVIDFGADPTGVADCSAAFNAAASQLGANGRHKAVYVPSGTYHIRHQINLTDSQGMIGDTRGSSVITVSDDFDPAATSVIFCTASSYDAGPSLRDFSITFAQPQDQGSRANFKTLAAGGTSHAGGTGVQYPWAIAAGSDSFRTQVIRVRIEGAWNGISTNNHNAIFQIEDLELGSLNVGISYGRGTAVLDQAHITSFHFWNFGLAASLWNVFNDGQNTALLVGAATLDIRGLEIFCGRVIFNDDTGNNDSAVHIVNCMLDGDPAGIEVIGSIGQLNIANIYGSAGTARVRPFISVAGGGRVHISGYYSHSTSTYPDLLINNGSADVSLTNFFCNWYSTATNWATIQLGFCRITNGYVNMASPRTAPVIAETANGVLVLDNVWFQGGPGSGPLLSMVNVHPWTIIGRLGLETGNSWTFSLPAGLTQTFYSPLTRFVGVVDFSQPPTLTGGALVPAASSTTPVMDGTATIGVGTTWARADHIHPTDTSRYAAANPSGYQTAANVTTALAAGQPGAFSTLSASSTVSGAGFTTYLASPPALGGTAPSTGKFTTVQSTIATGTAPLIVASTTNVVNLNASSLNGATFAAPGAIGGTTAAAGAFTTLGATSATTLSGGGTFTGTYAGNHTYSGTVSMTTAQASVGIDFGAVSAASALDLSRHITLYQAWGGFNIFGSALNIIAANTTAMSFSGTGATINGSLALPLPAAKTGTAYTLAAADSSLVLAPTGTFTLTLPAASASPGRIIRLKLTAAFAVNSASSNIVQLVGGAATAAIMTATAGKFSLLQSDGTNWHIMEAN